MNIKLRQFDLRLRHRFTISRGSVEVQPTLIVELEQDGRRGYGEATENSYYGETIERMAAALHRLRPLLADRSPDDPEALWDELHEGPLRDEPFAHSALDQAAHDLWGKLQGRPVWELWGLDTRDTPCSDYTIGIAEPDEMVRKLQEFPDWPCYKIKLGTHRDVELVRQLRAATSAAFRVDANCGWTAEETIANSRQLAELDVEFIEQPLPADQWDDMRRVCAESSLPLIADESCQKPADVDRCQGHFHGVNIKLVKCGGLTPGRRMIRRARELGLRVMVGCMTESTVGISAIAQLLPLLDYVDMDGAVLLTEDIASGVRLVQGRCHYPELPGSGVELTAPGRLLEPDA